MGRDTGGSDLRDHGIVPGLRLDRFITSKARCRTCNTYSEALRQALALASR